MCDQTNSGKGGPPYKPSARKSIHNHENCIFADCNHIMGRYGLKPRCNERSKDTSGQEGRDEVDNVMSKMACQSSPLHINKKGRRNSLHTPDKNYEEEDSSDSDLLAKSLPATMPSYCSDGHVAHQSLPNDFYKVHDGSSLSLTQTPNKSRSYTHDSFEGRNLNPRQELSFREESNSHSNKKYKRVLLPICGLISLVTAVYCGTISNIAQVHSKNVYDESTFNQDISNLGEKYQIKEQSLLELQTGITTISRRNDSGSFIFVYNKRLMKFDQIEFDNFIEDIALTAAKYLRNNSMPTGPTIVQSSELNMKSHSELMNTYRNDVAKTGVMLVKDIDMIPSNLAMAFHYFCDEYNPLVSKAAIFFTLNLESCAGKTSGKLRPTYMDIEKCLADKWGAIPKDNIKPLLARVVNVIIDLCGIS